MQVGNIMLPDHVALWDSSNMARDEALRGKALYDALMRLKPHDLPETDWATQAGVNRGFFSNLKGSEIAPRSDTLRKILNRIGKSEADLFGSGGVEILRPTLEDLANEHGLAFVEEVDLALGMGATFLSQDAQPEIVGMVPFRAAWLREMFRGALSALKVVRGVGDSMEPTVRNGDFVLVDTSRQRIDEQDAVWAICYGELGMIRRLRQLPGGGVLMMPDNQLVRPTEAYDGEMAIIGKVIWIGRRM